jgi:hypothetical protein
MESPAYLSGAGTFQRYRTVPLGFTPWNLYPTNNVYTNGHIEVECFNLLRPDGAVPLGPALCIMLYALCPLMAGKRWWNWIEMRQRIQGRAHKPQTFYPRDGGYGSRNI